MADENELSSDDKAYFESRGEKLPEKPNEQAKAPEEAEAETEALLDDEGVDKVEEKVEKVVPLRALTKEREESKKEKAARIEVEKKLAILEDRWNTILQLQTQQEQPVAEEPLGPEPDRNKDIFAHNAWLARKSDLQAKAIEELKQQGQQTLQEKQATETETRVWNYWHQSAASEKAKNPEFEDAVKWMSETRTRQLKGMAGLYPTFQTEQGITAQINKELFEINVMAAQAGANPAEIIFNMAKEWGYQGKAPDPAASEVAKLAKDIDAETSLSSAGGSRPGTGPTPKDIADMTPEAFEAWYTKHGAAGFKRLHQRGSV
jgi:hypothetical protein